MQRKTWLYVVLAAVLVLTFVVSPIAQAQGPVINLDQDSDNDGIPDALVDEVNRIATSEDWEAALLDFDSRLPYSPETRALQKEIELLQGRLATAEDPQEAEKIIEEIRALSERMMTDPNYAKTIRALTAMLAPHVSREPVGKVEGAASPAGVDWRKLKRGDIMLVFGNDWRAWIYAMKYSHAGNYDGSQRVYESNPSDGVRLKPLSNWQRPNIYIGLGRNNKKSESQVRGALDWAKGKYGDGRTPYNYVYPDKWTDSRLYCSQLVWKIHKYLGVDLDSNNWGYFVWAAARFGAWILGVIGPGVAPDEIGLSPSVAIYAEGWN